MKMGKLLLFVLILAALGLIAAYHMGYISLSSASDIRDRMVVESRKISSYSYKMAVITTSSGYLGDKAINVNSSMVGSGSIDLKNRFMYTPVSVSVKGISGDTPINVESLMEMYVVNDTLYSKTSGIWVKQKLNEDAWTKTQLDRQVDVARKADVRLIGNEKVNGKSAYKIEITPDSEALMAYFVKINSNVPSLNAELNGENIRNYTIIEWISTENLLPVQAVEEFSVSSGSINTEMNVTVEYYDYNIPIDSQVPEELNNAIVT